ncbi:hypothetical protein HU200_019734 [Digitaria exilis]|uniref:Uncharacterized protein n=1 Tax=Digitaria exilis TaxID=1010633 RepID=A0A835KG78_9POAL|nr:hypothetical protein HU200_019734 [Digitaria exilis]
MKSTGFLVICLPQSDRSRVSPARCSTIWRCQNQCFWLSRLGRPFWVAVLPYFCSTRVTGPAIRHWAWSTVIMTVFQ